MLRKLLESKPKVEEQPESRVAPQPEPRVVPSLMAEVVRVALLANTAVGPTRVYLVQRLRELAKQAGSSVLEMTGLDYADVPKAGGSGTGGGSGSGSGDGSGNASGSGAGGV